MRICRPLSSTCAITTAITQPCRGRRHPCIAISSLNHLSELNSNRSSSSSSCRLFTVTGKCIGYDSSSSHGNRFPTFLSNYKVSSIAVSSYPECSFYLANGFSSVPSRTKKKTANPNPSPKPISSSKASASHSKQKVSASKNSQSKTKAKTKATSTAKQKKSGKPVKQTQNSDFYDDEVDEDDDDFEDFDEFDEEEGEFDDEDFEDDLVETKKKNSPKTTSATKKSASKKPQTRVLEDISDDEDDELSVKAKNSVQKSQSKKKSVVKEDTEDEDEDFDDDDDEEEFDDDDYVAELDDDDATDDFTENEDYVDDEVDEDDDAFIDDMLDEEGEGIDEIKLGDGADGGGINISQTQWGEQALAIAKEVLEQFGSNFSLYAFKTSADGRVYVRLDKLSDKYGSPTMTEMESYLKLYNQRLEKAGEDGILPNNLALEVSSPGAERVVMVPEQLERFKDLPMLVRYVEDPSSDVTRDIILELDSFEVESEKSVWKLANVRANREQAGKGRGLTKKQREWRTEIPLSSLRLVRLYIDI